MRRYFEKILDTPVSYKEFPELSGTGEYEGIKAITYDGVSINNKRTKTFAYLGFPKECSEKMRAVVLVHGGGGMPFMEWIKIWNNRGYAAIAMSTTGHFPSFNTPQCTPGFEKTWIHGLHGAFTEEGYTDSPDCDEMKNSYKPIEEQWMYHAVSSVILAHNLLRGLECIDKDSIGLTGISWGGIITSIVIGFDNRFAFAIPVYGSGYLPSSRGYQSEFFTTGRNAELWLAEKNFSNVDIPVLWLCYNKDAPHFSLHSNSLSYIDTVKNNDNTRIAAINRMGHSHDAGWIREESYGFANSICKNAKRLPDFRNGNIYNPDNVEIMCLKVYYLTSPLTYVHGDKGETDYRMEQEWEIANIENLPSDAVDYYVEITSIIDDEKYITTSPMHSTR